MNEFMFWNDKEGHMEFRYGYFVDDALEGCDHKEDLKLLGGEYVD